MGASAASDPTTRCSPWSLGECARGEDKQSPPHPQGRTSGPLPTCPESPEDSSYLVHGGSLVAGHNDTPRNTGRGVLPPGKARACSPTPQRLPSLPWAPPPLQPCGRRARVAWAHSTDKLKLCKAHRWGLDRSLKSVLPKAGRSSAPSSPGRGEDGPEGPRLEQVGPSGRETGWA